MAHETKAERLAREANERFLREQELKDSYPERLMVMLERAIKSNFELTVKDAMFVLSDRDDRDDTAIILSLEYSQENERMLEKLEWRVDAKEEESREAERQRNLRRQAFNKLTKEEQQALGLNSEFISYW
jgi:hypothetical protein